MTRFEIWIDNDDRLAVSEYETLESVNEIDILRGRETYGLIQYLNIEPILNIKKNGDNITLYFKDYIINLNEENRVVSKRGMGPIIKNVEKYSKSKVVKEVKKKKVVRKNKHTGKKIIATGLVLAVLAGSLYLTKNNISVMGNDVENFIERFSISNVDKSPEVFNDMSVSKENNSFDISNLTVYNDQISTIEYENIQKVSIDYGDRSETDKAHKTRAYYGNMIEKYAKMYGMDPNLVIGIATQERGVHGTTIDEGGAIGLMQIQYNVWNNDRISAYNFETGKNESFIIDGSRLSDIEYNIKVGCMYLQNCMEYMNNNVVAAVQCYNMGYGSMQKILKAYSLETGKSVEDILNNQTDNGWLNYRDIINMGDQKYVEHVFSWMGEDFDIQTKTNDGSIINLNINNQVASRKIY